MNKYTKVLCIFTIIMIICLLVMGASSLLSNDSSPYRTRYALLAFSMVPVHLSNFINHLSTKDENDEE